MYNSTMRTATGRLIITTLGVMIMAVGINVFTTPLHLVTTGLMGYAQLIRSFLGSNMGISLAGIDLAGILYYVLSLPIFFITYRSLGKDFLIRTIIFALVFSVATAIIPVPKTPVVDDMLTNAIVGGLLVGVGDGMVLTCGSSVGGLDMLAVHIAKQKGVTVGRFSTYANLLLFVACFMLYDFTTVLYSIIYMAFTYISLDRVHQQSINVQVLVITKNHEKDMLQQIMSETGRGVTCWEGFGAYTEEPTRMFCVCINRYEKEQLERIVKGIDPQAFIIAVPGVYINGHFIHKV